jgi:hypothetical protein
MKPSGATHSTAVAMALALVGQDSNCNRLV